MPDEHGWRSATLVRVGLSAVSLIAIVFFGWMLLQQGAWDRLRSGLDELRAGEPSVPTATVEDVPATTPRQGEPAKGLLPGSQPIEVVPIGEIVTVGTWQVVVNDVRVDDSQRPLKGGRFVVVDWTIKNTDSRAAYLEIGGLPNPEGLSLILQDAAGGRSPGSFYGQGGYLFMAAPGDILRSRFVFAVGDGSLETVQLVMQFPAEIRQQPLTFDTRRRAPTPQTLLSTPVEDAPGLGERVVIADRWAFTIHGIDRDAGEDQGERLVRVDLTAENLQAQPRVVGATERPGSVDRRDFYLVDDDGYLAYSRAESMPQVEIGPGESQRISIWLYTHDLAPRGPYRLTFVLDWEADQWVTFDLGMLGDQVRP